MAPAPAADPARLVVAVDGPSGSGKSSVSRAVAAARGLRYLDTGATYRAVTWWMLEHGVDVDDPDAVAACAGRPVLEVGTDPSAPTVAVDGQDVAGPIRGAAVTAAVSAVSAVPEVRARLRDEQRACVGDGGIVVEGRDIGTVVLPDADVKVFLTASAAARAERRSAEGVPGLSADPHATRLDLNRRDHLDSTRAAAPLARAGDAVEVDATERTLDEVVALVLGLVDRAVAEGAYARSAAGGAR